MKPGITYLILGSVTLTLLVYTFLQVINMSAYFNQSFCDSVTLIDVINIDSLETTWMGVQNLPNGIRGFADGSQASQILFSDFY